MFFHDLRIAVYYLLKVNSLINGPLLGIASIKTLIKMFLWYLTSINLKGFNHMI